MHCHHGVDLFDEEGFSPMVLRMGSVKRPGLFVDAVVILSILLGMMLRDLS